MVLDPLTILMLGLVAVLMFFMFRNGKKRQAAMQQLQNDLRPGAEVMLKSGIFGTVVSIDEEDNRVTVQSGTSTLVAHRSAIAQIVTPVDAPESDHADSDLAPDDDPAFGERLAEERAAAAESAELTDTVGEPSDDKNSTDTDGEQSPKS